MALIFAAALAALAVVVALRLPWSAAGERLADAPLPAVGLAGGVLLALVIRTGSFLNGMADSAGQALAMLAVAVVTAAGIRGVYELVSAHEHPAQLRPIEAAPRRRGSFPLRPPVSEWAATVAARCGLTLGVAGSLLAFAGQAHLALVATSVVLPAGVYAVLRGPEPTP